MTALERYRATIAHQHALMFAPDVWRYSIRDR